MDVASYPDYKMDKLAKNLQQPQLKGRSLNELAPGKVWRTGANEAAEITLYKDMKLGETVKVLIIICSRKDSYTIIISKDLNV
jgi:hypothetical protein